MKDFLSIDACTVEQLQELLAESSELKKLYKQGKRDLCLTGKILAMLFEKPSTRTRVSFEVGMWQLGGQPLYIGRGEVQMGVRESVGDVARTLSRYVDGIMIRTFDHAVVKELAANASVPVVNGLTDHSHPCQALADLYTAKERFGELRGRTLTYLGDGNNVARSLVETCIRLGVAFRISSPGGYTLSDEFLEGLKGQPGYADELVKAFDAPVDAVAGADVVYTDVWMSMGQEDEAQERKEVFQPYQVNTDLLAGAAHGCIVMHCLPAKRGQEITDEVIDGPRSVVFDEAENRMHVQKGILYLLMGESDED